MTPKARDEAFGHILNQAKAVGIGVVSPKDIDQCNILKASLEAMKRAVLALDPQPEFCLVDGTHRFLLALPQGCLIRGDQRSRSISAASVVAKVYRDRIMNAYHSLYSVYGFDRNKGYGTRAHLSALIQHGPCPVHRLTFAGVR